VVSRIIEGQQSFEVVLSIKDGAKQSNKEILELPILTEDGRYVPLGQVASLEEAMGPNAIMRENASRRIVVSANVAGKDLVSTVENLQQEIQQKIQLPDGYFLIYGGQFESQSSASKLIYMLGLVALLAIFVVLLAHFRSVNLALQVMLAVPFAIIGAMFGIFLTDQVISIASLVGLITLTGIATRNGIMMIDHYLHLIQEEGESFNLQMLYRGTAERLVPVLMTALTAILALTPILIGGNEPGKEILYPVAVVIFSGLFSSTALNLLITPVIFWTVGKDAALDGGAGTPGGKKTNSKDLSINE
jgi:HME family heavy-metal exporter